MGCPRQFSPSLRHMDKNLASSRVFGVTGHEQALGGMLSEPILTL